MEMTKAASLTPFPSNSQFLNLVLIRQYLQARNGKNRAAKGARFCQLRMASPPNNTLAGYTELRYAVPDPERRAGVNRLLLLSSSTSLPYGYQTLKQI